MKNLFTLIFLFILGVTALADNPVDNKPPFEHLFLSELINLPDSFFMNQKTKESAVESNVLALVILSTNACKDVENNGKYLEVKKFTANWTESINQKIEMHNIIVEPADHFYEFSFYVNEYEIIEDFHAIVSANLISKFYSVFELAAKDSIVVNFIVSNDVNGKQEFDIYPREFHGKTLYDAVKFMNNDQVFSLNEYIVQNFNFDSARGFSGGLRALNGKWDFTENETPGLVTYYTYNLEKAFNLKQSIDDKQYQKISAYIINMFNELGFGELAEKTEGMMKIINSY